MIHRTLSKSVSAVRKNFAFLPMNSICRFTEEELQLQSMVRTFTKKSLDPIAAQVDKEDKFPRHIWPQLGELGLLGITAESEFGGSDMNYTAQCIATEELSRGSGSVGLSYIAHSNLCINQITRYGTKDQKKKFLPKLCSGEWVGALAMSEPNSGSDVTSMKTKAEKKGDKYILNGTKLWITNGTEAEVIVVYAKTENGDKPGITAFIVETNKPGFKVAQKLDKLGMRGSPTAELVFENLEVPAANVLGEVNKGVYILMSGLDYERLVLSAGPIGLMQQALDITVDYCKQRKQFNQSIGDFQLMQGKMADMYMKLQSSRAFLYALSRNADEGITSNTVIYGNPRTVLLYSRIAQNVELKWLWKPSKLLEAMDIPTSILLEES